MLYCGEEIGTGVDPKVGSPLEQVRECVSEAVGHVRHVQATSSSGLLLGPSCFLRRCDFEDSCLCAEDMSVSIAQSLRRFLHLCIITVETLLSRSPMLHTGLDVRSVLGSQGLKGCHSMPTPTTEITSHLSVLCAGRHCCGPSRWYHTGVTG